MTLFYNRATKFSLRIPTSTVVLVRAVVIQANERLSRLYQFQGVHLTSPGAVQQGSHVLPLFRYLQWYLKSQQELLLNYSNLKEK